MVSDAAATKAPIAKVADKVSGVFVPAVIAIAAVTIIVWLLAGESVGFALGARYFRTGYQLPVCTWVLRHRLRSWLETVWGRKTVSLFKTAVSLEETGKVEIVASG